ncbi:PREDICTED: uncharacterized protein LOC106125253 isoform X1 [Papilio xuthus]|uniref:Uncharacterized protein LOC106125253 isoform X1 n=1 Tax=Papilio xuthus TaxID=66420 RepID=A0AAJ6ZRE1_PAPXU|nr:PREDICTED: uncharacterized protein LOC106125253 isoform X1 [Papilio xuthus]
MKVLKLLLQLNLCCYAVSFVIRKTKIYRPIPTDFVNNLEQQSSNFAGGDIKLTFLENNPFTNSDKVLSIGNLIKSLRIPGFIVYRIVLNRDDTENYEKAKLYPKLETIEENKHLSNIDMEKRNCSEALNFNEINKEPDYKNVVDQKFVEINCDLKSSIDKEISKEETTTNINEVTTEILNENSTVTSEYDDENYGSLSDRHNLTPAVVASLLG